MRKVALLVMLFMGVITLGVGTASAESKPDKEEYVGKKQVVIQSGDTLTKIAKKNETTYVRLFNANTKIKNPDLIYPGEKVRIPHPKEKLKDRKPAQPVVAPQATNYSAPTTYNNTYKPAISSSVGSGVWDRLAACESGGNWAINTGNGYYGGLQFNLGTWQSNGGRGYPHQASKAEQIRVAENLRAARGFQPWPSCSAQLGLR